MNQYENKNEDDSDGIPFVIICSILFFLWLMFAKPEKRAELRGVWPEKGPIIEPIPDPVGHRPDDDSSNSPSKIDQQ